MTRSTLETVAKAAPDAPVRIKRILVPFDFGGPAAHALDFAQRLAPSFGASVEALYVVPTLAGVTLPLPEVGAMPMSAATLADMVAGAKGRLHQALAVEDSRHRYLRKTVKVGDPRIEILAHASAEGVDLIVMGTHGHTGVKRIMLGSVTEFVARVASCPVLTVH
jgi:nucleotide-binding universal stress UspA family protein